mgnify:CR=1 FL=1
MIGERGGWKIDFDPSSARLMLSHDSGADVSGELAFRQEEAAWRIDLSRDGVEDRLALIYDAPGRESTSHMRRNIGLAWLELPLSPPTDSDH